MGTWDIDGKVCLITGATSGIGKAAALELARRGAHVVFVARDPGRRDALLEALIAASPRRRADALTADLSNLTEVEAVASAFKARFGRLDVLVNNAGAIFPTRELTVDGYEHTFALNHLSYFTLTQALHEVLVASAPARIVNVASRAHTRARMHFDDLQLQRGYSAWRAYGQSKLANVLFTRALARRLEGTAVTANALHPGVVATGFGRNRPGLLNFLVKLASPLFVTAEQGADTLIWLASSPEVEGQRGGYYVKRRRVEPSRRARSEADAERLWTASEQLVRGRGA
jgi:retinol dehydrogenase 12